MGTASLVLGIISVVTGWACCGVIPGLISFILGLVSFIKNKDKKGLAGMILSFIGSGVGIIIVLLSFSGIATPISTFLPSTNSGLGTTPQTTTTTTTVPGMPSSYEIPSYEEPSFDWEKETSSDYVIDWDSIWGDDASEKESASETKETKETSESVSEEKESEPVSEETSEKEEKSEKAEVDQNEIRPEVKAAIDSYEDFMDGYIDFMNKYNKSNNSTELLMDYLDWIGKYADMVDKMDKMEGDLTDAEAKYYSEVTARITGKMVEFSLSQ